MLIRRVLKLWRIAAGRGLKMHFKSVAAILQRLLCMPRAQLHAECYKTQHGCLCSNTHACMHATHKLYMYVCRYVCVYSVTLSLACSPRSHERAIVCVCVCACEKCAPSMWNRTQKLCKLLRRSPAKQDRERERESVRRGGRANEA